MSILTTFLSAGVNNFQTTAEHENAVSTDMFTPGVVGTIINASGGISPQTGPYAINAQSTPDTTVSVLTGVLYVQATPSGQNSQILRISMNASQNVTISPNTTGSTVYDWIYMKVDPTLANAPDVNGTTVSTLYVSRSTSNTTDTGTPPTYGLLLSIVSVANNFVTITNGTITDKRVGVFFTNSSLQSNSSGGGVGGAHQGVVKVGHVKIVTGSNSEANGVTGTNNYSVTFPITFSTTPTVLITDLGLNGGNAEADNSGSGRIISITTTGFSYRKAHASASYGAQLNYIAIGQ